MNYTEIKLVRDCDQIRKKCTSPKMAALILRDIEDSPAEQFIVIALDSRRNINAIQIISRGTADASLVGPREVFQVALLTNSTSIILAHNHPSGETSPSEADLVLTSRLTKAAKILDIEIADHIIVGENGTYTSFKNEGLL